MGTEVDMLDAKNHLSKVVDALERGQDSGTPDQAQIASRRIGIAKGEFVAPEDIDADNHLIQQLFNRTEPSPTTAIS